jgi:hypothetical protein
MHAERLSARSPRSAAFYADASVCGADAAAGAVQSNRRMSRLLQIRLRRRRPTESRPALECPFCSREAMCPMDWGTSGDSHWWLLLRCAECELWSEIVVTNEQAAALDVELDRQMAEIARAVHALDAERMAAEVDTFVAALERDLVDAADFAG